VGAEVTIPTVSAGDWVRKIAQREGVQALRFTASLEFTERCNFKCVHCYINQPAGAAAIRERELSLTQWQGILDQMEHAGVIWLLVTGGEPLLRPDFPEFYVYARKKGFHVTLFTNGTLVTPDIADLLARYPPWEAEITLYGATQETYEEITGIPGSYQRCIRGIELLLARGIELNLKTMVLTLNAHELPLMQAMAAQWGTKFRYDFNIYPRLDRDASPNEYRLTPEQAVAMECRDEQRVQKLHEFCGQPWGIISIDKLFTCGSGLKTFHLDAFGGLYPCMMVRWLRYDLLKGSLEDATHNFLPQVRDIPVVNNHTCNHCDLRVLCQNCPGWAYLHTGDPEAIEPFQCELAKLRQQTHQVTINRVG